ncbi:MAG: dipeptidase PepE [Bacteroidota bacterium]
MNLLLFSNSTNAGQPYLGYTLPALEEFLKESDNILFIPYAAVTFSYDEYTQKVNDAFAAINKAVTGIHKKPDKVSAVREADTIIVGGGNTFHLLKTLQEQGIMEVIAEQVKSGTKYVGWSAGSNLTCPSIKTTNDMPVVEPQSFKALNLIPFQINPHYLDANPDGHAGETREQRIEEFLQVNQAMYVVGLREGSYLSINGSRIKLHGGPNARIFHFNRDSLELSSRDKLDFLIQN